MRRLVPALFKLGMVVSILEDRKLQTSRLNDSWGKLKPGDLIWGRENFSELGEYGFIGGWNRKPGSRVYYKTETPPFATEKYIWRNKPCIFLRKSDCRILLEVTSVEKRKLNSITDQECIDEGINPIILDGETYWENYNRPGGVFISPCESFISLWNSINGQKEGCSWTDYPEVWMVKFKVLSKALEETQRLIKELV